MNSKQKIDKPNPDEQELQWTEFFFFDTKNANQD